MKQSITIAFAACSLLASATANSEVLHNVTFGSNGLTFDVSSYGCTVLEDFIFDVTTKKGVATLTITRVNPDVCTGPKQRISFTVDYATAGISSSKGVLIGNVIARVL